MLEGAELPLRHVERACDRMAAPFLAPADGLPEVVRGEGLWRTAGATCVRTEASKGPRHGSAVSGMSLPSVPRGPAGCGPLAGSVEKAPRAPPLGLPFGLPVWLLSKVTHYS